MTIFFLNPLGRMNLSDFRRRGYDDDDDVAVKEEEEVEVTKEEVAAWEDQARKLKATEKYVYILTLEEWSQCRNYYDRDYGDGPSVKIIGLFNSKAAAVAKSVTVKTMYGKFDETIKDICKQEGVYVDYRKDPPDDGTLFQIGDEEDFDDGAYARLVISKQNIFGLPQSDNDDDNNNQKKKRATAESQNGENKKQKNY